MMYLTFVHSKRGLVKTPFLQGGFLHQFPDRSSGLSQYRPHLRGSEAAVSTPVVRRQRSVTHNHFDGIYWYKKFFCHNLSQGGSDILTYLHLTGKYSDFTIFIDMNLRGNG